MQTNIASLLETNHQNPIVDDNKSRNKRPRGRCGAIYCNNPNISYKEVRKIVRQHLGKKAFFGETMEKAINNAAKLVNSHETRATHRGLGHAYRHPLGIQRDISIWIVLFSVVNMATSRDGNWFKCFVDLTLLDELAMHESLSRGSRAIELYRCTEFLKVYYRESKKNLGKNYLEIHISRKAFHAVGVTDIELNLEIGRAKKAHKKRLNDPSTKEHHTAKAMAKVVQRAGYEKRRNLKRKKKQQQKINEKNKQEEHQKKTTYLEAVSVLKKYEASKKNNLPWEEIKKLFSVEYPRIASMLWPPPTIN